MVIEGYSLILVASPGMLPAQLGSKKGKLVDADMAQPEDPRGHVSLAALLPFHSLDSASHKSSLCTNNYIRGFLVVSHLFVLTLELQHELTWHLIFRCLQVSFAGASLKSFLLECLSFICHPLSLSMEAIS